MPVPDPDPGSTVAVPDPDPKGMVVAVVEPPTAVTFPTLTLPFLTLNPKVYEYAALFSVIRDLSTALLIAGSSAFRLAVAGDGEGEIAGAGLLAHLHPLPSKGVSKDSW